MLSGCNNDSESWYGEVNNNKYINKKFDFEMDIPTGWEVNLNLEESNMVSSNSGKDIDDLEECIIGEFYDNNTKNKQIQISKTLIITEGLTIRAKKRNESLEVYASEVYNQNFGDDSVNPQKLYDKSIKNKKFKVIEYKNNICYITESENRIIIFDAIYSNESKDKILKSMNSIEFK